MDWGSVIGPSPKVNELNSVMCQLSDHVCTDGFCCYNKINNDLFLNNCNVRHSVFACLFLFVGHIEFQKRGFVLG